MFIDRDPAGRDDIVGFVVSAPPEQAIDKAVTTKAGVHLGDTTAQLVSAGGSPTAAGGGEWYYLPGHDESYRVHDGRVSDIYAGHWCQ